MLNKIDNLMYLAIWILEDWGNYLSISKKKSMKSKKDFQDFKKEIKAPEISEYGLKRRVTQLRSFDLNLIFYGAIFIYSSIFIISFLFNIDSAILVSSILSYTLGVACVFSFRVSAAAFDLIKYKKHKKKDTLSKFKISNLGAPKPWDLIPGIAFPYLYYQFVNFAV